MLPTSIISKEIALEEVACVGSLVIAYFNIKYRVASCRLLVTNARLYQNSSLATDIAELVF